jgi:hypothetical protein
VNETSSDTSPNRKLKKGDHLLDRIDRRNLVNRRSHDLSQHRNKRKRAIALMPRNLGCTFIVYGTDVRGED